VAPTMSAMNIFEALRVSHQTQRELYARLLADIREPAERDRVFQELKHELVAHETAEERCFYVPLFEHDSTVDASRHAIAEHHEMDEMVEGLEQMDAGTAPWREAVRKLCDKIEHHLTEEEQKFFPQARRVLPEKQREDLGKQYEAEFLTLRVREG
jgi:hemerythrin-like domain-containing protein